MHVKLHANATTMPVSLAKPVLEALLIGVRLSGRYRTG